MRQAASLNLATRRKTQTKRKAFYEDLSSASMSNLPVVFVYAPFQLATLMTPNHLQNNHQTPPTLLTNHHTPLSTLAEPPGRLFAFPLRLGVPRCVLPWRRSVSAPFSLSSWSRASAGAWSGALGRSWAYGFSWAFVTQLMWWVGVCCLWCCLVLLFF